ncbi:Sirohydrochlorin cobaltochelatase, putative [Perkinsus marinus ATCC 50983]|uniref:Sirohydrochlorin cobaltochelatase, putative n=1 Tax=Perkinsus marinus (strain ATCC 50983 / TXsc) TaxID=423536 RepID=C5LCS1_PERM5|nr:Sirohydrochlorin cobaltochelatase, putative [Perkinsus marinus ATCC 50983]EER05754.1 Sirohydrochlorin cobaltochelatase, putative [Perkinsus marinus ATCC 50983]|eukprot:XP_002773938.1 Sirohydrochlorin cobaltochelatase, putative [Perkinsus marinus ATCC 50983]
MTSPRVGLILIDHGSPSSAWNKSHEELLPKIEEELSRRGLESMFSAIRWCHMEFVQPSVAETMNELEREGISRVIALPVFISVSSHTERDLPNILNIRFHPDQDTDMVRYTGNVPVTLCTPLDHQHGLLPEVIAQQAVELMMTEGLNPCTTGAVILSHGDGCEHFWQHMHRSINNRVIERTDMKSCEGLYVQTMRSPQAQRRFREYCKKVLSEVDTLLVLAAFNGTSGATFVKRADDSLQRRNEEGLPLGVLGCPTIFLSNPAMVSTLVDCAVQACQVSTGRKGLPELNEDEKKALPPYNPPFWLTRDATPGYNDRTVVG